MTTIKIALTLMLLARGNVLVQTHWRPTLPHDFHIDRYVFAPDGTKLSAVSYTGVDSDRRFFSPFPNLLFVTDDNRILHSADSNGFSPLLVHDVELSEISPIGNGNFLVAEVDNHARTGARVLQFDARGAIVDRYVLPAFPVSSDQNRVWGAWQIELLGDQCTLLYSAGWTIEESHRIRRYNICTRQAEAAFVEKVPVPSGPVGSIRQIPGGDVLIATEYGVLRYTRDGGYLATYPFSGAGSRSLPTPADSGSARRTITTCRRASIASTFPIRRKSRSKFRSKTPASTASRSSANGAPQPRSARGW